MSAFWPKSERDDLAEAVARVLANDYEVEERMTLNVRVKVGGAVVYESWALNEATVEKAVVTSGCWKSSSRWMAARCRALAATAL